MGKMQSDLGFKGAVTGSTTFSTFSSLELLILKPYRFIIGIARRFVASFGFLVYRNLPLSTQQKIRLRHYAFKFMPTLFVGLSSYEAWAYQTSTTRLQDILLPKELSAAKRIMIFLVPEHNAMSGGIYSIFSIAHQMWRFRHVHGYEVLVMTRPTPAKMSYFRNSHFRNFENVFRFDQILRFVEAREIYLHIPEYAAPTFLDYLTEEESSYLKKLEKLHINILNQNIKLMPSKTQLRALRHFCKDLSQSVAHHAYYNQGIANTYNLPTLFMPAYTDLSNYPPADLSKKEKLIIYSPDESPHKKDCLEQISRELPEFKLVEIRDITFDRFMDYATRSMFSITFGEGFDGYLAQPILQGGIGFAIYNDDFFPSPNFKNYSNIFDSPEDMVTGICAKIRHLSKDQQAYKMLNVQLSNEYSKLYSFDEYVEQIKSLSVRRFGLLPHS
ncbi:MAG: hypothetical protein KF799_06140 [Bdellovibrionales bacterium]|nr:hypothetical protein [Bdellovibrionales bacterium]